MATTITIVEQLVNLIVTAGPDVKLTVANEQGVQGPQGSAGNPGLVPVFTRQGNLYMVTGTQRFYVERTGIVNKIRASVGTAPVGSAIGVTVLKNGSSFATLSIAQNTNTIVATSGASVTSGDYFTVNITSVGSTTPGADLTVAITID